MIKNKKLLLGLGTLTVLLPTATIVSCGSSTSEEDRITNVVKSNIINKDSIRWILPGNVNSSLYNILFFHLQPHTIEGFNIVNIKTSNPDNSKGTLKISYDLVRGNKIISVKEYEISGFLTSNQQKINNDNFKNTLDNLGITEQNGLIPLRLNPADKDSDIENEKNKDLASILDRVIDSSSDGIVNKLKNLLNSTSEEKLKVEESVIYKMMDFEVPVLLFNVYIQKGDVKSSKFTIMIMDLKKQLKVDDVKKFINLVFWVKSNDILATSVNKDNATNYIDIENINVHLTDAGFIGQVKAVIKDVKNQNNEKGSIDIDLDITLNNGSPFNFKTTIYGFKITTAPIITDAKANLVNDKYEITITGFNLPTDVTKFILKDGETEIAVNSIKDSSTSTSVTLVVEKANLAGKKLNLTIKGEVEGSSVSKEIQIS